MYLRDVEGCETDGEDDQHGAQQLDGLPPPLPEKKDKFIPRKPLTWCFIITTAIIVHLPALLHQPAVSECPHDPDCENHDHDEGQEELGDGEKEELR